MSSPPISSSCLDDSEEYIILLLMANLIGILYWSTHFSLFHPAKERFVVTMVTARPSSFNWGLAAEDSARNTRDVLSGSLSSWKESSVRETGAHVRPLSKLSSRRTSLSKRGTVGVPGATSWGLFLFCTGMKEGKESLSLDGVHLEGSGGGGGSPGEELFTDDPPSSGD